MSGYKQVQLVFLEKMRRGYMQNMDDSLQNAKIVVLGDNGNEESTISVLFNPAEYKLAYGATYMDHEISGTETVITQFVHGNQATLDVSLYFDSSEYQSTEKKEAATDVTSETKNFIELVYINASLHRPPHIRFQWGPLNFLGIVTQVTTNYTLFEVSGMPVRAQIDLSIKEVMESQTAARKTPFESPDRTKCRSITVSRNLWHMAYEEYGDMGYWRTIAQANHIVNPIDIPRGEVLKVPVL